MSEITDPIQATPYGIAVAGLLEIEDICDEVHDCDVSDIRAVAVKAREAASKVNADHIAAALLPVTTPAVTRPPFGSTLILAVPSGTDEADVQRLRDHLAASAPDEHVTVTVVRDVEALRTWEPQPAAGLAAAMAETASRELAAAMAEARGYRNALQQVAKHIDSEHAQLRIVARIAKRAMEGL